LAEYVASADLSPADSERLSRDVFELGQAVDWRRSPDNEERGTPRRLAPPEPGQIPKWPNFIPPWEAQRTPWKPAKISLDKVWLCDAPAQVSATEAYRRIPEFEGALTAANPTPAQRKIQKIIAVLETQASERSTQMKTLVVAGDIHEALDAAHRYYVEGIEPTRQASAGQDIWAVFVARRSFVVREFLTRYYEEQNWRRTEFMVLVSAYLSDQREEAAPVTFGLIELGPQPAGHSIGVSYNCRSACGSGLAALGNQLVETTLPEMLLSNYRNYVPNGSYIEIE